MVLLFLSMRERDPMSKTSEAVVFSAYISFIPHSKGGANSVANVQLLCRSCNLKKSDRI